jgi:ABC-type lipoprotein export system ATPase subunit
MAPEHLKLEGISKQFAGPEEGGILTVLSGITLAIPRGESVAITGPSGSGKSTLLHIIGGLERPTAGAVWMDGRDLAALSETELAGERNQSIGFVFQAHYLLPQCTVLENVLVPTLAGGKSVAKKEPTDPAAVEDRARRLIARVGLEQRLHHRPAQLSGGEQQRAAVVRALINQPQVLLADEPTGSLDPASAESLGQLLSGLNKEEGVTLIVVTHSMGLAQKMSRVLELRRGKLEPVRGVLAQT